MDKLLGKLRWKIACYYIDDMIVYSPTFGQHLIDLREVLTLLHRAGLTLKPTKCFVGYHSMKVLGHVVDRLGLSTTKERAQAILQQPYLETLRALEFFVGVCGIL